MKGRSSSRALAPLLRKLITISLAFAVYAARLNPSDDPTRDVPVRSFLLEGQTRQMGKLRVVEHLKGQQGKEREEVRIANYILQ